MRHEMASKMCGLYSRNPDAAIAYTILGVYHAAYGRWPVLTSTREGAGAR